MKTQRGMDLSFMAIDSSNLNQYLREACAKADSLEEGNKLQPEDVFQLNLSFNKLKVADMFWVHEALLRCPKLVVNVGHNHFSWPESEGVISSQHLRLWGEKCVSMASTVQHELTEAIVVHQAEDDMFSEMYMQLGRRGMDESFSMEDAVRAALMKAYEAERYFVVPIDYPVVYGHTGKAIYGFDVAYAAHKPDTGEDLLLLGDSNCSLSRTDLEVFLQKVDKLTNRFYKVDHNQMPAGDAINYATQLDLACRLLHHTVVKFVAGQHMLPEAISKARDAAAGCHLVAPDGSDFTVYCDTDIDEDQCRLAPPPPFSQMKCSVLNKFVA